MNILVVWGNESKTILVMDFVNPWTTQDLIAAMKQAAMMMNSVDHEASTVVDLSHEHPSPSDILAHFSEIAHHRHPRTDTTVIVSPAFALSKMLTNVFSRIYGGIRIVDTLEEAYTLLGEDMPSARGG